MFPYISEAPSVAFLVFCTLHFPVVPALPLFSLRSIFSSDSCFPGQYLDLLLFWLPAVICLNVCPDRRVCSFGSEVCRPRCLHSYLNLSCGLSIICCCPSNAIKMLLLDPCPRLCCWSDPWQSSCLCFVRREFSNLRALCKGNQLEAIAGCFTGKGQSFRAL